MDREFMDRYRTNGDIDIDFRTRIGPPYLPDVTRNLLMR